ncbi:Uma2 family endonuclease [Anatilimnocola sp. NA78]|uniref:Uma2 family endonuclease n=1 Tax=Anatilimnocola sp. NA78 TaxID=3415683 RepID=UPI003CE51180
MTTSLSAESLPELVAPPFPVQRFTVAQYFEIAEVLGEGANVELLEGWIVPKMVKKPQHDNTIDVILGLLEQIEMAGWFVRVQNVLRTADSAPEPDLTITRGKRGDYPTQHPEGKDVALVIEVADASLSRDRRKAIIYAKAGVPAYWIVNLRDRCVEVFDQPTAEGAYARQASLRNQEQLEIVLDGQHVGGLTCDQLLPDQAVA